MVERQFGIEIMPLWREAAPSTPETYILEVRVELQKILRSAAGRALAAALRFHHDKILLMPFEGQECNAQEDGVTPGSDKSVVLFSPASSAAALAARANADRITPRSRTRFSTMSSSM